MSGQNKIIREPLKSTGNVIANQQRSQTMSASKSVDKKVFYKKKEWRAWNFET